MHMLHQLHLEAHLPFNSLYWVRLGGQWSPRKLHRRLSIPSIGFHLYETSYNIHIQFFFQFPLLGSLGIFIEATSLVMVKLSFNSLYWVHLEEGEQKCATVVYFQFPLLGSVAVILSGPLGLAFFQFPLLGSDVNEKHIAVGNSQHFQFPLLGSHLHSYWSREA